MRKVRMHSQKYLDRLKARNKVRKSYNGWLVETGQTQCHYCGKECGSAITADHKKPLSKGGYDKRANVVPACKRCNERKDDMLYDDFMRMLDSERERTDPGAR